MTRRKRARRGLTLLLGLALAPSIADCARAKSLTVTCDEPTGPRLEIGTQPNESAPKVKTSTDSFTGVRPTFVFNSENSTELTVIFGSTTPKGLPSGIAVAPSGVQSKVVFMSDSQISALEEEPYGIWIYSLFPKIGYGIFTRLANRPPGTFGPSSFALASMMQATCCFASED